MLIKQYRLAKEKDFQRVFKKGKITRGKFLILKVAENKLEVSRFGFVVSLKISKKATERNRIRRQLQEAVRKYLKKIRNGVDIVVLVRPEIKGKLYPEIESELLKEMKKAGIRVI